MLTILVDTHVHKNIHTHTHSLMPSDLEMKRTLMQKCHPAWNKDKGKGTWEKWGQVLVWI